MKTVKCTECNREVRLKDLIVSKKPFREGCNFYGHVISKKRYDELKKKASGL